MNSNTKTRIQIIMMFALAFLHIYPALGWSELSHIIINYKAGAIQKNQNGVIEAYGELPDMWSSRENRDEFLSFRITDAFTWSHNVIRAEGDDGGIPKKPEYRDPAHEPGLNMLGLRRFKLESEMENPSTKAWETARAFSTHNAADEVVHFDYFLADDYKGTGWLQHGAKERWADYILYVRKLDDSAWWQRAQFPPKVDVGYNPDDIDIDLIRLSQMINRKNRLSIAKDKCGFPEEHHIEVLRRQAIINAINATAQRRQEYIDGMRWWKYQGIRRGLGGITQWSLRERFWGDDCLVGMFNQSVQAVETVITGHDD